MTRGSTRQSPGALAGVVAALALVGSGASGCIETRRQVGDTTPSDSSDSSPTDTTGPDTRPDSGEPVDGTGDVPVDTTEVEPDVQDGEGVEVRECEQASDCEPEDHDGCVQYDCVDFRCLSTPKNSVPCDDGNACTEGELCDDGVCRGGSEIDCEPDDEQCWEDVNKTCDPITGCGLTALPRGTRCDDDHGPDAGTCVAGWRIPEDTCDGLGQCLDRSTSVPGDNIHPLAGAWHVVISTAPTGRSGVTVRAVATFDNQGTLSFSRVARSATGIDGVSEGNTGTYCTSLTGETLIELSGVSLVARADKAGEVMVLSEADVTRSERIHGVAIRGSGSPAAVTGTYRLVSTALHQGTTGQLMTWQGEIGFEVGCLSDAGAITTGGGLGVPHSYDTSVSACFFTADGSQRILLRLLPAGTTTPDGGVPVQWTGAIGGRGDILLLTRDDGGLRYGILVLVKDRATDRANLFGEFGFVSVTGGMASSGQTVANILPRLERGVIDYRDGATVAGALSTDEPVGPGWWWTAAAGTRYAHRVVFGTRVLEHSGWIARSDAFIMGWRVGPPVTLSQPQPLDLTPLEGSLFLGVKSTDYRVDTGGAPE